jgi:hypothetical protein
LASTKSNPWSFRFRLRLTSSHANRIAQCICRVYIRQGARTAAVQRSRCHTACLPVLPRATWIRYRESLQLGFRDRQLRHAPARARRASDRGTKTQYSVSTAVDSGRALNFVGQSLALSFPERAPAAVSSGKLWKSSQSPSGLRSSGTFLMPYNVRDNRHDPACRGMSG